MKMGNLKLKKIVFIYIWLHFLFNLVFRGESGKPGGSEACKPSRCSKGGPDIRYPFYIPEKQGELCGYPGFEIACIERKMMLGTSSYSVEHINYEKHSIKLVSNYSLGKDCLAPHPFIIPPNNPFLNYTSNYAELLFFYECVITSFSEIKPIQMNCSPVAKNISYVALITNKNHSKAHTAVAEDYQDIYLGKCHSFARVPVELKAKRNQTIENTDYKMLVTKGFTQKWSLSTEKSCVECRKSGGWCGQSKNQQFACYCRDGVHDRDCNSGYQQFRMKIIISVVGSIMAAGVCTLIYFTRCRPKNASLKESYSDSSFRLDLEGSKFQFDVPIFSNRELEEATNNFSNSNRIGDGGFGTVYYGKLEDGREVAVKRLYNHNVQSIEQFMNEVKILTSLRHKNLVSLYGCTSRRSHELLLVYEYIANGTVADHIHGEHAKCYMLPWQVRMSIAIETAAALAYLHASGIIHRDVKTHNILLDNNYCVKVADFGLSRLFPTGATHVSTAPQGTPGYVDPEYHLYYQLTQKSDVYSFGVVLIELVSSKPAVDINRERHEINLSNFAVNRIQKCAFRELIDPALTYETDIGIYRMITSVAELAFCCLQQDKEMRPSMDEVLQELMAIAYGVHMLEICSGGEGAGSETEFGASPSPPDRDDVKLLKIQHSPTSVTQGWGSISSNSSATCMHDKHIFP